MGLDMYLYLRKESYCSKYTKPNLCKYPQELQDFAEEIEERNFMSISKETNYQVGYWRKFNALHGWIVEHCADGKDDCRPVLLDTADIEEIISICQEILEDHSKAKDLMPTTDGFFFGTDEYDDWYYQDMEYTLNLFKKVLKIAVDKPDYSVVYEASW